MSAFLVTKSRFDVSSGNLTSQRILRHFETFVVDAPDLKMIKHFSDLWVISHCRPLKNVGSTMVYQGLPWLTRRGPPCPMTIRNHSAIFDFTSALITPGAGECLGLRYCRHQRERCPMTKRFHRIRLPQRHQYYLRFVVHVSISLVHQRSSHQKQDHPMSRRFHRVNKLLQTRSMSNKPAAHSEAVLEHSDCHHRSLDHPR